MENGEFRRFIAKTAKVYSKENSKKIFERTEEVEEGKLIIGEDFNARICTEGAINRRKKEEAWRRNSKDKIKNSEGRMLIELLEEGGFTFVGQRGSSVIDYAIVNTEIKGEVKKCIIAERVELDYMLIIIELYRPTRQQEKEERTRRRKRIWTEGKRKFQEEIDKIVFEKEEINEMVEGLIDKLNKAVYKKRKKQRRRYEGVDGGQSLYR